ncbi:phytanoyl-CoA dioxygenase family protein [Jatrophihabitans sp.]|uniref:phytanoyl-CoA dioxygenase family protein n=1 Tax=Jatrophihabitans sp. TaxID=1932789 RepID=UPI0030C77AC4|nr:Phytanoyl-CoA dioxygenase [Jatrophihabitans sp.]
MSLTQQQLDAFVADGFVRIEGAVPRGVAETCRDELWTATGYDPHDPSTWAETLVRINGFGTPPFRAAATGPELHEAFDQLVGEGQWLPRTGLGTFPLRFPGEGEAPEAGWHVESSFAGPDGQSRVSLRSRGRALLMLFLFSDVGPDDAPTLIRVGSHLDVPAHLSGYGDEGRDWLELCREVVPASAARPVTQATGALGDVFLCHPFLVHSAQRHRGRVPRFMAQPPLDPAHDLDLEARPPSPVVRAILDGLR